MACQQRLFLLLGCFAMSECYALRCLSCQLDSQMCDTAEPGNYVECDSECYAAELHNLAKSTHSLAFGCNSANDTALIAMGYREPHAGSQRMTPPQIDLIVDRTSTARRGITLDDGRRYSLRVRFCRSPPRNDDGTCAAVVFCRPPYCLEEKQKSELHSAYHFSPQCLEQKKDIYVGTVASPNKERKLRYRIVGDRFNRFLHAAEHFRIESDGRIFTTQRFEWRTVDNNRSFYNLTIKAYDAWSTRNDSSTVVSQARLLIKIECPKPARTCHVGSGGFHSPLPPGDVVFKAYTCVHGEELGQVLLDCDGCYDYTLGGPDFQTFTLHKITGMVVSDPNIVLQRNFCYQITVRTTDSSGNEHDVFVVIDAVCRGERPQPLKIKEPKKKPMWKRLVDSFKEKRN